MFKFNGFPEDTIQFYVEIADNNNKAWFEENKPRFKNHVQKPAQEFVEVLGERLRDLTPKMRYDTKLNGAGSIMRIYRDVRFSKDKTPYKTNLGIVFWSGEGKKMARPSYYFGLDATGADLHCGLYRFPDNWVDLYRQAVVHDELGPELERVLAELAEKGYNVWGEKGKRVPRGYDKDHPRADLLLNKGLGVSAPRFTVADVSAVGLVDRCVDYARDMAAMVNWFLLIEETLTP